MSLKKEINIEVEERAMPPALSNVTYDITKWGPIGGMNPDPDLSLEVVSR